MCCGQKRTELRNSQTQRIASTIPKFVSGNSRAPAVRTQPSSTPAMQTIPPPPLVNAQTRSFQPQAVTTTASRHPSVGIRYLETSQIRVRGLVSGMFYEFSGSRPVQQVDARDASSLLNTRFFRRA